MIKQLPLLLFLSIFCLAPAFAVEALNGTTALIQFEKIPENALLSYEKKNVPLLSHPSDQSRKIALVPVNYRSEPGEKTLRISWGDKSKTIPIHVGKGEYASEAITVAPSKVTLNEKQKARTKKEYEEAMKVYNTFTRKRYWSSPFTHPMHSAITSPFGTARTYNGTLKSFHSGTDFKAAVGMPVNACNDGVVVIAQDRYYAGNSVVIDHGEGLYSCYYHLSKMDVNVGDTVRQNQQIGLSGKSGRVTGPHLHFAFILHGVQVDPLQLMETINSLYDTK